jgi:hypothetical protein
MGVQTCGKGLAQGAVSSEPVADELSHGPELDLAVIQGHYQLSGGGGEDPAEALLSALWHLLQIRATCRETASAGAGN